MREEYTKRFESALDVLAGLEQELTGVQERIAELERLGFCNATVHWRKEGMMELLHPTGSEYERKTGRRREYIGTSQGKQQAAIARIERHSEWRAMKGEARRLEGKIRDINHAIKNVFRVCGQPQNLDRWGQKLLDRKTEPNLSPQSPGSAGEWGQGTARSKNGSEDLSPPSPGLTKNRVGSTGDSRDGDSLHPEKSRVIPTSWRRGVSPRGFVPKDMSEVKAYFEQSPELASIAKDLPG